jgi:hypothetical protein
MKCKDVAYRVIVFPPREFEISSQCCNKEKLVRNGEIGEIAYGITSVIKVINFCPAIL